MKDITIVKPQLKEEGLLAGAFHRIRNGDVEARWLMNQSGFNNKHDHEPAEPYQIASIAFAVAVETYARQPERGADDELVRQALNARTIGDLRTLVAMLAD